MDSKKINQLATNVAPSIYDLTVVGDASTGQLKKITLNQIASLFGSVGGVSSVAMTVPTGLTVTGSPITTSGTLAVTLTAGYSIPTTAKQSEWDLGYSERLKWDGGSSGLNASTARSSLGLVIGTDVLAYRTFGSAANNNTADFATAAQGVSADTAFSLRITGASVPLSISSNVISISQSTTSTNGFLSSTDWNTFNGKQQALNGTGFVKATGTSISYDNSTYYLASNPSGYITSSALSSYLPLSGGTLTGGLNINLSGGSGFNVASDSVIFRSNTGVGTPRQVSISMGGGSTTTLEAKGYGANYITDFNIKTYNSAGTSFDVFYGTSAGDVGINNNSPAYKLDVNGTGRFTNSLRIEGAFGIIVNATDPSLYFNNVAVQWRSYLKTSNNNIAFSDAVRDVLTLGYNGSASFFQGGNVLINSNVDNGQGKLQVNGNIYVSGIAAAGNTYDVSSTLSTAYYHIINTPTGSGQTFTLPSPTSNNLQYVIVNKSDFSQTISAGSGFTIYNMAGLNSATITLASKARCFIIADGSSFYQIF
jgi:hypothetical protein